MIDVFKKYIKHFIVFSLIITIFYLDIFHTYFQGDEWHFFSQYLQFIREQNGYVDAVKKAFINPIGPHFAPLLNFLHYFEYKLFKMNFALYAFLSLFLHSVVTLLLFILVEKLTKNRAVAWTAAIFFGISAIHYQAVTWMATYLNLEVTAILALVSFLYFLSYVKTGRKRNLFFSSAFLFLALLVKESAAMLFIVYPVVYAVYKRKSIKKIITELDFLFITGAVYIVFYTIPKIFSFFGVTEPSVAQGFKWIGFDLLLFRLFIYSVRSIAQVFIPPNVIMGLAERLAYYAYPPYGSELEVRGSNFLTYTQGAGSDTFIFLFAILITMIILWAYRYLIHNKLILLSKVLIVGIVIIVTSVWPLIFIGLNRSLSWWGYSVFIDSRHFYFTSMGAAIIFAIVIYVLYKKRTIFFLVGLLVVWFVANRHYYNGEIQKHVSMGKDRKTIIKEIRSSYPDLPKSFALYAKSNKAYYGFGGLIFPFQTNFGKTLLTYYAYYQDIPLDLLYSNTWKTVKLDTGGVIKEAGYAYGYYVDKTILQQDVADGLFKIDDIVAYSWNGESHTISNITDSSRQEVREFLERYDAYESWETYTNNSLQFEILYPPDAAFVRNKDILDSGLLDSLSIAVGDRYSGGKVTLSVYRKPETLGVSDLVYYLQDSDGNQVKSNYTFQPMSFNNGITHTAVVTTSGEHPVYFLNLRSNTEVYVLEKMWWGHNAEYKNLVEEIVSTLSNI